MTLRLLSGHTYLREFWKNLGSKPSHKCRECGLDDETLAHVIIKCKPLHRFPAIRELRDAINCKGWDRFFKTGRLTIVRSHKSLTELKSLHMIQTSVEGAKPDSVKVASARLNKT